MTCKYPDASRRRFIPTILLLAVLVLGMGLTACSQEALLESLVSEEESEFAENYLEKLRLGDYEHTRAHAHESLRAKIDDESLDKLANYFRTGTHLSTMLVGYHTFMSGGIRKETITFESEFEDGWMLADVALVKQDDQLKVISLNMLQTEGSQEELNKFTLEGKSIAHLVTLLLVIVIPLFLLVTIVVCIRTPIPRRKWLWLLFILVGVGSFTLNWTTGEVMVKTMSFQILSSGLLAGPNSPWILTISIPIGAIVFWSRRKSFIEESLQEPE